MSACPRIAGQSGHARGSGLGPSATGLSQPQVRAWSAMPPKAEGAHSIGAAVETTFTLMLQSEYPTATQQERTR
jgi:hypothetical protein